MNLEQLASEFYKKAQELLKELLRTGPHNHLPAVKNLTAQLYRIQNNLIQLLQELEQRAQ